jgi:hypothetical protein
VTASYDKTVRIWDFPWTSVAELIDVGIARAPRCLVGRERRSLFLEEEAPEWCYALAKAPYRPRRYGFVHTAIDAARAARLRLDAPEGVVVGRVDKGLSARAAGLRVDDVVLAADGAPVPDQQSLTAALDRVPPNGSIRLTVLRAGQRLEIELKPAF